jgi:uncharacterized membrane protein
MVKKKSFKPIDMVEMALFMAIIIVLAYTPLGYIPLGVVNATTVHIPVIIAGVVLGWRKGAFLGFIFGVTSFLNASFLKPNITSFLFSPLYPGGNGYSLIICFLPRILIGIVACFVFRGLIKLVKNEAVALAVAGAIGSMTNTVLVMGGAYIFFAEPYAQAIEKPVGAVLAAIIAIVVGNGIPEAICAGVLTVGIGKALLIYRRSRV